MEMKTYIGTKTIKATLMSRGEYNNYRGWTIPENENPNDEGYLVEYLNSSNKVHPNHDNYISWSPKKEFEDSYREVEDVTFDCPILKWVHSQSREQLIAQLSFAYSELVESEDVRFDEENGKPYWTHSGDYLDTLSLEN